MTTINFTAGTTIPSTWLNDVDAATYQGVTLDSTSYQKPHFGFGTTPPATNIGLFYSDDVDVVDGLGAVLQVQRHVTTDTGNANSKALKVSYIQETAVNTADNQWAISGDCTMINTGAGNMVSVSGVTTRTVAGTGVAFGGHFQVKDSVDYAVDTDVQNAAGVEINIACKGPDHPTANGNAGRRLVLHILPHGVNPYGSAGEGAEVGRGIAIETEGATNGAFFRTGLEISESSGNANPMDVAIKIITTGTYGINMAGIKTGADIIMQGNSAYGLLCNGTYTNSAIRVADDQYIGLRSNNAVTMNYDVAGGSQRIRFMSTTNERVGFDMSASPGIFLNGTKVVGVQNTGWTAMTGTSDKSTVFPVSSVSLPQLASRVNAIQAALTQHGLLA